MEETTKIIDGRAIAKKREEVLRDKISTLSSPISVVSILVGDDPASVLYTNLKKKKALSIGIEFQEMRFPVSSLFEEIGLVIKKFNNDPKINGIMVQLPLPKEFLQEHHTAELLELISPNKDIDGLTTKRMVLPAAVKAVFILLEEEKIAVSGKKVAVLGALGEVGQEIVLELEKRGAETLPIDIGTQNREELIKKAEIIISAVGKPGIVTGEMISDGVIVIDVGTLVVSDSTFGTKVLGDVDFESVVPKASKITPVPGGVGPVTITALMENIIELNRSLPH